MRTTDGVTASATAGTIDDSLSGSIVGAATRSGLVASVGASAVSSVNPAGCP
jgi:hypothetical protein